MAILATFIKQPGETQDYDILYDDWIERFGDNDTLIAHATAFDAGINFITSQIIGKRVKVWFSGGVDGVTYKVTVTVTTSGGRVKEAEIRIKVKEY